MAIYGTIFLECRESFSRHEQEIEVWEMSRDLQWKKILKDGWIWIWCRKTSEIIPRNWLISIKSDGRKLKNAIVIRNKMVFIPLPVLKYDRGQIHQFSQHIYSYIVELTKPLRRWWIYILGDLERKNNTRNVRPA